MAFKVNVLRKRTSVSKSGRNNIKVESTHIT